MAGTGDSEDPNAETQYHLEVGPDDVADSVLLPGNPERVETVRGVWDEGRVVADHREYRSVTGTYEGTPISVTSTGIGSPSAAIAVEELARVGVDTLIRVGSCGGLDADTAVGDLVITTGAVRQEGTSDDYARPDYPAVADREVVAALVGAAERLDYDYHVGLTMSSDTFYPGQERPGYRDYLPADWEGLVEELRSLNVRNVEMEASAVLTTASVYGLRAGAVCTVYANRETGEFGVTGEGKAAEAASLAVHLLAAMDREKRKAGAEHWHPGLALD